MKYEHVVSAFFGNPWAITREKYDEIKAFLQLKAAGGHVAEERLAEISAGRRDDNVQMSGRVAVLPVFGVISQRVSSMEAMSGGVSAEELGATLDKLVADKQVRAIVLQFDSPGGSVYGVEELGRKIFGYRGEKKIVGIANPLAASAAYWLLTQTAEINVTPSGQVGSIGVIASHQDWSAAEEKAGVKTSLITSSKYKAEGNPYGPLGEEARSELQSKVDQYHAAFVAAVARGRGVTEAKVNKDFGQGRMLLAKEAVERGMADRVATLEQVIGRLGGEASRGASAALAARARLAEVE